MQDVLVDSLAACVRNNTIIVHSDGSSRVYLLAGAVIYSGTTFELKTGKKSTVLYCSVIRCFMVGFRNSDSETCRLSL